MKAKNTICLWLDQDAHEAAGFYAVTFPDSNVTAVHEAPSQYPGGKKGDVLTVGFPILGIPCLVADGSEVERPGLSWGVVPESSCSTPAAGSRVTSVDLTSNGGEALLVYH